MGDNNDDKENQDNGTQNSNDTNNDQSTPSDNATDKKKKSCLTESEEEDVREARTYLRRYKNKK